MVKVSAVKHIAKRRGEVKKSIVVILTSLVGVLILTFFVLRIVYPGILRAGNRISQPGIDLMEMVEIGGISQALYFRGQDVSNPVILYLHGGPGGPMFPFLHTFQYDWEHDFTVVQWDQRNAGKTFYANDPEAVRYTMSGQRVLEDAYEVTMYIKQKLNKDKIIVMGHSWGSVLGTMLVQTYPEAFCAYIGVGQVSNMTDNERVGYEKVLEAAKAAENKKDISAIEELAPWPPLIYDDSLKNQVLKLRGYQAKYGLAAGVNFRVILDIITSPYYSSKDIMYFTKDMLYYQGEVMRFLSVEYDIRDYGLTYEIPVFFIMGEQDYQTPYPVAKDLLEEISAPVKMFFSIPNAGHNTMTDNRVEFNRVLLEEIKSLIG